MKYHIFELRRKLDMNLYRLTVTCISVRSQISWSEFVHYICFHLFPSIMHNLHCFRSCYKPWYYVLYPNKIKFRLECCWSTFINSKQDWLSLVTELVIHLSSILSQVASVVKLQKGISFSHWFNTIFNCNIASCCVMLCYVVKIENTDCLIRQILCPRSTNVSFRIRSSSFPTTETISVQKDRSRYLSK